MYQLETQVEKYVFRSSVYEVKEEGLFCIKAMRLDERVYGMSRNRGEMRFKDRAERSG